MSKERAIDYTLKPDYVSVILFDKDGVPESFALHSSHPTYVPLVKALKKKNWDKVPHLVTLAKTVADQSEGNVEIKNDGIYFKGTKIDNALTKRINQIVKEQKPVKAMLRFMDNLYQNPESFAINELYDWLKGCNLPITDDGCFMAYKRVGKDYKDCYTGKIDNSPGQIVFMERSAVDPNRHNTCSRGLHFCSVAYLSSYTGERVMKVKINPKDVVSIPPDYQFSKGRTWMYEVIGEVDSGDVPKLLRFNEDIDEFQTAVYSIARERSILLKNTLELMAVRRSIKKGKLKEKNIRKLPYGRLVDLFRKMFMPEPAVLLGNRTEVNRLKFVRESYGLTRGMVAAKMRLTYKQVHALETAATVTQDDMDAFLRAVTELAELGSPASTAVSCPKPTRGKKAILVHANDGTVDKFGYSVVEEEEGEEENDD